MKLDTFLDYPLKTANSHTKISSGQKEVAICPNVLSKEEVKKVLEAPKNVKHRAILSTIYGAGLRIGEVINLRIVDVRSKDGYFFIRAAKGEKGSENHFVSLATDITSAVF